jgi:transposase-like protein
MPPPTNSLSLRYRAGLPEAVAEIVLALTRSDGNVSRAAERLGVHHRTLCRWIAADPRLRTTVDAARGTSTEPHGAAGGRARAKATTKAERRETATRAARARWGVASATRETPAPVETPIARVVEEENRVRIVFVAKPDDTTRAMLRGRGFKWSPSAGAWQRMASPGAWYAARLIVRA